LNHLDVSGITKLARSAQVVGPIAFGFGAGVALALGGLGFRAQGSLSYEDLKLVLLFSTGLISLAGALALIRFWILSRQVSAIVAADLRRKQRPVTGEGLDPYPPPADPLL
jgi:hypothetical protein